MSKRCSSRSKSSTSRALLLLYISAVRYNSSVIVGVQHWVSRLTEVRGFENPGEILMLGLSSSVSESESMVSMTVCAAALWFGVWYYGLYS